MAFAPPSTVLAAPNSGTHSCSQSCSFPTRFSLVPPSNSRKKKSIHLPIIVFNASTDKVVESETENLPMGEQLKPLLHESLEPGMTSLGAKPTQEFSQTKSVVDSLRKSVLSTERQRRFKNQTRDPPAHQFRLLLKTLNACQNTRNEVSEILDSTEWVPAPREATFILNNLNTWQKSYSFFQWLDKKPDFEMNKILYNVTMKALRRGRQWDLIEDLIKSMVEKGIDPDNFTYSTVISSARQCGLLNKAIEWFERMREAGCVPNEVTYTTMINAYGGAGRVEQALNMYERAKADGCRLGHIVYATLLRMYSIYGDADGALVIFQEMKDLGIKPHADTYEHMFSILAKAMKPDLAKSVYQEMVAQGVRPNEFTIIYLLKVFGKAGWADDVFRLWETVNKEPWPKTATLCNTMLTMSVGFGRLDMAEKIFLDMIMSKDCKPDALSYSYLISFYAKHGLIEEANAMLVHMREAGFKSNVVNYTHLIYCYGQAKQFDEVVRVFNQIVDEGLPLDEKLCVGLLTALSFCENEEVEKILVCLERANPNLACFIRMVQWEELDYGVLRGQFFKVFNGISKKSKTRLCNMLIDLSYTLKFPERSQQILSLGLLSGVYSKIHSKSSKEWCLDVTRLSFHAALTALQDWISSITEALENSEEIPPSFVIYAGHGRHRPMREQSLASQLERAFKRDSAPFERNKEKRGWFLAKQEELLTWMQSNPSLLRIS